MLHDFANDDGYVKDRTEKDGDTAENCLWRPSMLQVWQTVFFCDALSTLRGAVRLCAI